MTTPPDDPSDPQQPPYGQQPQEPPYGQQPQPPHGQAPQPPYGQAPQPGYGQAPQQYGQQYAVSDPAAPYGRHPMTGEPLSDKSKLVAGLLQLLIPLGIGRFYLGHTGIGVAQLLVTVVTCGLGAIWPFIDGILILIGNVRDAKGRPLRD